MNDKQIKIGIVTSSGGHLYKTMLLRKWWGEYERFWVTSKRVKRFDIIDGEKIYCGYFPENRNLLNFFKNLLLAWRIINKEKPDILFSMGAGIAPPFFIVGKILGVKLIFLETFILINKPTLSGRLVYPLVDLFLVQNPKMINRYPKARWLGSIL